jgi:hypothetical protein
VGASKCHTLGFQANHVTYEGFYLPPDPLRTSH